MQLPAIASRVGRVCGPGQFPKDDAGTVVSHESNQWGSYAVVHMDDGTTQRCHGLNTGPGIGWHGLHVPAGRIQVGMILALTSPDMRVRVTAVRCHPTNRIDVAAVDTLTAQPVYLDDLNPARIFALGAGE